MQASSGDPLILSDEDILEITPLGIRYKGRHGDGFITFAQCCEGFCDVRPESSGKCVGEHFADGGVPVIVFYTAPSAIHIRFPRRRSLGERLSGASSYRRFLAVQKTISGYGYTTYDGS